MAKPHSQLRSELAQARGLGSAKHGVGHRWLQRVTALALVPLSVWLVASLLRVAQFTDPFLIADWLGSPLNAVLMAALIVALFWHAKLGVQVVIEDYVHAPGMKYMLLLANTLINALLALVSLLAIIKLHMMHIFSGM